MDNSSVEKLYLNYKDQIYNFILRLVNDPEIAMDVTQQTFLKVVCDKKNSNLTRSQIIQLSREILYQEKKAINEISIDVLDEGIDYHLNDEIFNAIPISSALKILRSNINSALTIMSIQTRELMILYFIENISIIEIALITKRSIIDVKVSLHQARIVFEKTLIKNMRGKVTASETQCHVYTEIVNSNSKVVFSEKKCRIINHHISKCVICLNSKEQLKRTGVLLNLIPIFNAPKIIDRLISNAIALNFK